MLQETWNKSDNKGCISDEISPISYFIHHAKKNIIFQKLSKVQFIFPITALKRINFEGLNLKACWISFLCIQLDSG